MYQRPEVGYVFLEACAHYVLNLIWFYDVIVDGWLFAAAPLFSESEGEGSGEEGSSGSCFPSPKMKKLAGLLGSPSKSSQSSSDTNTLDKKWDYYSPLNFDFKQIELPL